jgi:hypothetical protein
MSSNHGAGSFGDLCATEGTDHVVMGDELIVFSPAKRGYFGVEGVAKKMFGIVVASEDGASEETVLTRIAVGRTLMSTEIALIRDGIQSLLDLGVLYEK